MEDDNHDDVMPSHRCNHKRLFAAFPQHQYPFQRGWYPERCLEYRIESHVLDPSLDLYDWAITLHLAYSSGICYWLAHISVSLQCIADDNFCANNKSDQYAPGWFLRSLILAFLDPSLDVKVFICLRVTFTRRISQLLNLNLVDCQRLLLWSTSLFIVDHSAWQDSRPLLIRNGARWFQLASLCRGESRTRRWQITVAGIRQFSWSILVRTRIRDPIVQKASFHSFLERFFFWGLFGRWWRWPPEEGDVAV